MNLTHKQVDCVFGLINRFGASVFHCANQCVSDMHSQVDLYL